MTPKSLTKKQRALAILSRIQDLYPDATCSLDYATPVQLLVATILSAQCTDERVNKVTPGLFKRFPDAESLANADLTELEELVRSTGFYRNKAKNIQGACRMIVQDFNAVKFGKKLPIKYNLDVISYETLEYSFNKNELQDFIKNYKSFIKQFTDNNSSHLLLNRWNSYYNQLNNLNLDSIVYPFNNSLEQYFNNLGQPSFNILQLP